MIDPHSLSESDNDVDLVGRAVERELSLVEQLSLGEDARAVLAEHGRDVEEAEVAPHRAVGLDHGEGDEGALGYHRVLYGLVVRRVKDAEGHAVRKKREIGCLIELSQKTWVLTSR